MEVNDEAEFTVSDRAAFETLISDLGFAAADRKEKRTKSFSCETDGFPVTLELSLVGGLGWFLELEIISDSDDQDTIERAGKALRRTLAQCGISESAIEARYYTELLALRRDMPFCQEPKK